MKWLRPEVIIYSDGDLRYRVVGYEHLNLWYAEVFSDQNQTYVPLDEQDYAYPTREEAKAVCEHHAQDH